MNWNNIYDAIIQSENNIIYMAIGCAMGRYHEITENNNQQYPCFLNKFDSKKVIILIDPELETPLKCEPIFNEELTVINNNTNIRLLTNSENTIFAINDMFYYELNPYMTEDIKTKTLSNIQILHLIINTCLESNKKLIFQDFTGLDTINFYLDLFNYYDKDQLLNNIMFDFTQENSGCTVDINYDCVKLNNKGYFIQEKFMTLKDLYYTESKLLNKIIKKRIDNLNYPILWIYNKMLIGEELRVFSFHEFTQIKLLCSIYDINYELLIKNNNIELYKNLIIKLLQDILFAKECEDLYNFFLENISNLSIFQKKLSLLKFD